MNRTLTKFFTATFLLMLPTLAFALAGAHDPATGGRGFTCNSCHTGTAVAILYPAGNMCVGCHDGSNDAVGVQKKNFTVNDYKSIGSDVNYGGGAIARTPKNTSHKWVGPDVVPSAKALAPTDPYNSPGNPYGMNRRGLTGLLTCARCHAVHNDSQNKDPLDYDQSKQAPYIRALNTADQMCMDCHRERNKQDHTTGTHPVMVTYTSVTGKAKIAAGQLKATPLVNATNPTAQLQLKKGMVVCSSCHGVHYSDSDSSTFDNHSTAKNNGLNTTSSGALLHVSLRAPGGAGVGNLKDATNLCTNCHTKDHAGQQYQHVKGATVDIQCVDCHSPHVDISDAGTVNKYMLRRFVNYSGVKGNVTQLPTYRKRLVYTDDVTVARWATTDGTGVCQACHALPNSVPEHTTYPGDITKTRTNCITCHANAPHSDTAPAGNCTDCHGQPPTTNTVGGTTGYVAGYTNFNESTTPHGSHALGGTNYAYSCTQCHNGNNHNDGIYDVFKVKTGIVASTGGANPTFTTPNCTTNYCHSDGNGVYKSVSWNGTKGSLLGVGGTTECNACHDNRTTTFTGSHAKHVTTMAYGCATCHATTVSANFTVSNKAKHVDGVKDVSFSGVAPATGTTCSNVACHSNSKGAAPVTIPVWGQVATGACGACHATATNGALATGSHQTHFTQIANNDTSCATCHTYTTETATTHVNGSLDLKTPSASVSCGVCHADPYSASFSAPTWGTSASGCSACHSANTIATTGPATGSHVKHNDTNCADCHTGATTNATIPSANHADGNIDVANGYPVNVTKHAAGSGYATCSTASCHANVYGTGSVVTPVWGATAANCTACHTTAIATTGPATGSHVKHNDTSCVDCHTGATNSTTQPSANHIDGNIDVANGYPANVTKHTTASGFGGRTCSTASCHANVYGTGSVVTPVWGATAANCTACHTTSIATTGPATGSHAKHNDTNCADCHTGATNSSTQPSANHIDGNIDVANGYPANVAKHTTASGYAGATCSTASCHVNVYGTGSIVTPVWGATAANCTACHSTPITATGPATGSHATHMGLAGAACTQCHAAGTTASIVPSTGHIDGNIDATSGYAANVTKHASGTGYGTCSTNNCHGTNSGVWGTSTTDSTCVKCHGVVGTTAAAYTADTETAAPGYNGTGVNTAGTVGAINGGVSTDSKVGAHDTHLKGTGNYKTGGITCADCHAVTALGDAGHMNGQTTMTWSNLAKNVGTSPYNADKGAIVPAYSSPNCSTNYCHGGAFAAGVQGTGTTVSWTSGTYLTNPATSKTQADCNQCHVSPPTSSAKFAHTSMTITTDCSSCHGHNGASSALHINGILEATGGDCNGCHDYDTVTSTYSAGKWTGGNWGKAGTNFGGYPSVSEGWGAHAKHINVIKTRLGISTTLTVAGSFGTGEAANVCGTCHTNNSANHNMSGTTGDTAGRMINFGDSNFKVGSAGTTLLFGASNPVYNGVSGTTGSTTNKTCSNLSCHYFTTPLWSTY